MFAILTDLTKCTMYCITVCAIRAELEVVELMLRTTELDNLTTRSGALFKPTAPLGVETTGRSEDEITLQRSKNQSSVGRGSL